MKNNIYSTLNLSKSLEQFQEKVTKLLELTNIPEFDVQVFKFREEKIRESALVLAGEWIEPKLLTIYTVNEQGQKVKNSDIPITNDGTYEGYEGFLKI